MLRQILRERIHDTLVNSFRCTSSIYLYNQPALTMRALPVATDKASEGALDTRVELVARLLHAVTLAARRSALHSLGCRNLQHDIEIGHKSGRRKSVRGANLFLGQSPAVDLVGVGGKKEPVHEYNYTTIQRRVNLVPDELSAGGHEEEGLGGRRDVLRGVQEQRANRVAERGASRLAQGKNVEAGGPEALSEELQLSRLARAFGPFDYDEPPGAHSGFRSG